MSSRQQPVRLTARILKRSAAQRLVYGWASVIEDQGGVFTDAEGDTIDADELERAATAFMASDSGRRAGVLHDGRRIGLVVHSMPLTREVQAALGLKGRLAGWAVALRIEDAAVWAAVEAGELAAFSLGGTARRRPLTGTREEMA